MHKIMRLNADNGRHRAVFGGDGGSGEGVCDEEDAILWRISAGAQAGYQY